MSPLELEESGWERPAVTSFSSKSKSRSSGSKSQAGAVNRLTSGKRTADAPLRSEGRGGGHAAVADDVRKVWDNCQTYLGQSNVDHPLLRIVNTFSVNFESAYRRLVLDPLDHRRAKSKLVSSSDANVTESGEYMGPKKMDKESWKSYCDYLSQNEYMSAPLDLKLNVLSWLCGEVLNTSQFRAHFDEFVDDIVKVGKPVKTKGEKGGRRGEKDEDSGSDADEPRYKRKKGSLKGSKVGEEVEESEFELPSSIDAEIVGEELGRLDMFEETMRLKSLGKDRDNRVYWTFSRPEKPVEVGALDCPRIFCEDVNSGYWRVYSDPSDINKLLSWLSEKGIRENALRKAMIEWMQKHGIKVKLLESDKGDRTSRRKDTDSAKKTGNRSKSGEFPDPTSLEIGLAGLAEAAEGAGGASAADSMVVPEVSVAITAPPKDYSCFWARSEHNCIGIYVTINLMKSTRQLGLGLKVVDERVVVSNFKLDEADRSAGKAAGLRIGDVIVAAEGLWVGDIAAVQLAMRRALDRSLQEGRAKSSKADKSLSKAAPDTVSVQAETFPFVVLVVRWPDPLSIPGLKESIERDPAFMAVLSKQSEGGDDQLVASCPVHHLRERFASPGRLVGFLIDLLLRAAHPFVCPEDWAVSDRSAWVVKLFECLRTLQQAVDYRNYNAQRGGRGRKKADIAFAAIDCEEKVHAQQKLLCAVVQSCIVDFESALCRGGNMMSQSWLVQRKRFRWRRSCLRSTTFHRLSLSMSVLEKHIVWDRLSTACTCITRKAWLDRVPKHIKTALPPENASVFYFGDGHIQAVNDDRSSGLPLMWGGSFPADRMKGVVAQCTVSSVRVLLCGPPDKFFPFAQIDLLVVPFTQTSYPVFEASSSEESDAVFRIVNRVVNIVRSSPSASPFLDPVCRDENPDYDKIISRPMDLTLIRSKAREGRYTDLDEFLFDFSLLRDNCRTYCAGKYPFLVEQAEQVHDEAVAITGHLRTGIVVSHEDAALPVPAAVESAPTPAVDVAEPASIVVGSALKGIKLAKVRQTFLYVYAIVSHFSLNMCTFFFFVCLISGCNPRSRLFLYCLCSSGRPRGVSISC